MSDSFPFRRCMTDANFVSLWDMGLQEIKETVLEENESSGLCERILNYRSTLSPDGVQMTTISAWGKDPHQDGVRRAFYLLACSALAQVFFSAQVFFVTKSEVPDDQIFPEILELISAGVHARATGSKETRVCVVHVTKFNVG